MKEKIKNLLYIFGPLLIGGLVGLLTKNSMEYNALIKPPLSPPAITFPIVWSILYLLIGISYYLFRKDNERSNLYILNLVFNFTWPFFFFTFRWYFFSLLWILILDISLVFLIKEFYNKKRISAYLLIPYLVWLIIATYLNIGIFILN